MIKNEIINYICNKNKTLCAISMIIVVLVMVPSLTTANLFVTDGSSSDWLASYSDTSYDSNGNKMQTLIDVETGVSGSSTRMLYAVKVILTPATGQGYYIQTATYGTYYAAAIRWHDPESNGNDADFTALTPTSSLDYNDDPIINLRLGVKYSQAIHSTSALDSTYTRWNFDMSYKKATRYYSAESYGEVDFKLYATTGYYDSASVYSTGAIVTRGYTGAQSISVLLYGWFYNPTSSTTSYISFDWLISTQST